jgi:hypothetical protein
VTELAASSSQRDWWRRTWLVLREPSAVFGALRDESEEEASARQEPALAIAIVAGIALALSSSAAAHLFDDPQYDALLVAVWAFLAGGLTGTVLYWFGGLLLHFGVLSLGSRGGYRRTRQLLAFAAVPLALSLALWLPRLLLYGGDWFRFDGADAGAPAAVFGWLQVGFALWALALLVLGLVAVEGWTVRRSAAAVAIGGFLPVLIGLAAAGVI